MFEEQDPREPLPHLCPRLHFLDGDRHLAGTRAAHHRVEGSTSIKFTKECPSLLSRGRCEFHCEMAVSMYGFTRPFHQLPRVNNSAWAWVDDCQYTIRMCELTFQYQCHGVQCICKQLQCLTFWWENAFANLIHFLHLRWHLHLK